MLISGSDKDNYKELKEELDPYTLDDLLNLKRYHALCLMKYEGGWGKFIVKMPKPLCWVEWGSATQKNINRTFVNFNFLDFCRDTGVFFAFSINMLVKIEFYW